MNDLTAATENLYTLLKEKKATYSNGIFVEKKTLMKKYHISEQAIISAHNEGTVLDVYAPFFKEMWPVPHTLPQRAPKLGETIIPNAYTLIDLSEVPRVALYGQLKPSFEKRNVPREIINELEKSVRKNDLYLNMSDKAKLLEKGRLQKNTSPRKRIENARRVIEGADLGGSKELEYLEQKKSLEGGVAEAARILSDVASGRLALYDGHTVLNDDEGFANFFSAYPGSGMVEVRFKNLDIVSERLAHIENCKETIERYNLDDKYINAILDVPLGSLPSAWIEVM